MKQRKSLIGLILNIILTAQFSFGQEVISVIPSAAFKGDLVNAQIAGQGTNFQQGLTTVDFGSGITTQNITVNSSNSLSLLVQIETDASIGLHNLTVSTGSEVLYYNNAIEILEEGINFNVILFVIPEDPLYISGFEPGNPESAPLLFTVELNNNDSLREDLMVEFICRSNEYGDIASATKTISQLSSLSIFQFDNREFDEYSLGDVSQDLMDEALGTGLLPPGVYTYTINVYDDGNLIGGDEGENIVTNSFNSIDLIGPGSSINEGPTIIYSNQPYFQWFSMATFFDFTLYEVMEGQTSPDEIITNLPVYEETNLGASQFLYPIFAELLQLGKTYAWQVKAHFSGSMGQETIYSDLFWFNFIEGNGGSIIDHLEITPVDLTLETDETFQFHVKAFDQNLDTVPITCAWYVIPSSGGNIDINGNYSASHQPGTYAIIAEYNEMQVYSTVTLEWGGLKENLLDDFVRKMFGLSNN